jgi:hypothetical protein
MIALQYRLAIACTVAALCLGNSGCSSPIGTKLPDSTQTLKPVLSSKAEKQAVDALTAEKIARKAEAEKALEQRK